MCIYIHYIYVSNLHFNLNFKANGDTNGSGYNVNGFKHNDDESIGMSVCMHMYVNVFLYICRLLHTHICTCTYMNKYIKFEYVYVWICTGIQRSKLVEEMILKYNIYIYIYIYTYIYVYLCIYINIYIYVYIYSDLNIFYY
jgi:hypothetical protein